MVRTFQLTKALSRMTVLENMKLGGGRPGGERFLPALVPVAVARQEAAITERADDLLVRFKLDHMRDEFAGTLSGGQKKLLEMARALMVEPALVMLDEPMAGVNPALTQSLLGTSRGSATTRAARWCSSSTTWTWCSTSPTGSCAWPGRGHRRGPPRGDRRRTRP
jgi:neutral amino acid transport system ATP-binding protein